MKKILPFVFAIVLILSCVISVSAEDNYSSNSKVSSQNTVYDISEESDGMTDDTVQAEVLYQAVSDYDNFNIIKNVNYTIRYDDVFDVGNIIENYAIIGVVEQNIVSKSVSCGVVLDEYDNSIIEELSNGNYVATGVGNAKILLVNNEDLLLANEILNSNNNSETVDAIMLNLDVTPAPITVAFIAGQSNAEGYNSLKIPFTPLDSVVCDKSQVYSTYAPSNKRGVLITGLSVFPACTKDTANDYVAGNLSYNSITSLSDKELIYKLDSLSENGMGKCGFDSAFAYEWNKLTNDKVWVINSAAGGSSIGTWQKGQNNYERAMAVFKAGQKTLDAEVTAGHYVLNKRLLLWLQGEKNVNTKYNVYDEYFKRTVNLINSEINPDCFGIILTRSAVSGQHNNYKDLTLSAPRIVQPLVSYSKEFPNVYMLSTANEYWVSDEGVQSYFSSKYPGGYVTYPLRSTASISAIPNSVSQVHFDIHYLQIAHNETGLDIARNYYDLCYGADTDVSFDFITQNGIRVSDSYINDYLNEFKLSLRVNPPHLGKKYTLNMDPNYLVFDNTNGVYVPQKAGVTNIDVLDENQMKVHTLKLTMPSIVEEVEPTEKPTEAPTEEPTEEPTQAEKPIKVTNITTKPTDTNMAFTWDAVEGAFKYWMYKYNEETGTWASVASAYTNEGLVKLLKADTEYQFKVICKFEDGTMMKLADADIITVRTSKAVATDSITGIAGVVDATITWNAIDGATKYWVYKATSANGPFYIYNSAYETSCVVRNLRPDTDYYFKVVGLTDNNGIPTISDINASPSVHVRTISATQITTVLTDRTASTVSISWPQFMNADKYWLKISETTKDTNDTAAWKTIKSTTDLNNLTYTFKGLEKCKTYYVTVQARYYEDSGASVMVNFIPVEVITLNSE